MHWPPTEHWSSAYCTCTPCTHARMHARTHAHTITELTLPLSNGEHPLHYGHNAMNVRPEQGMGALTVVNVTVTVKVSLHIKACGKGSGAVRGIPSCSRIRQQCGQTLHSVLFFQMCSVLNSTSHNRECSEGLTVNGLQVITPPHNMYCTRTQESGTSATQTK